jgi:mono/diheme cytochrome c family protein
MFYNGFGRGDFAQYLMASNLLTVKDSSEARSVSKHFGDVLAYIVSLQPPKYPKPIDKELALKGEIVFIDNCSRCHGTYGKNESYPNLLIPIGIVQTDSALIKSNQQNPQFIAWFNNSWLSQGITPAKLVPFNGYIAPPLDGVWITAPYFHNGSVPNLGAVLNSKLRPTYWQRNFKKPEYDYENVGWKYEQKDKPELKKTYNTTLYGYGNYGHYFGDHLSDADRKAVIEYLKTL